MLVFSLKSLGRILNKNNASDILVVISKRVYKESPWVMRELRVFYHPRVIELRDGEDIKNWKSLYNLLYLFAKHNAHRKTLVFIVGGGTVGDLAGFACSIYLRGIPYVQIPTTLLAQIDSSIGGKTGINFLGYKNQIGSFYPPIATCIESKFLKTLTHDQLTDGFGEILKMGLIHDPTLIKMLNNFGSNRSPKLLTAIVARTARDKERLAKKDLKDKSSRQLLNFGHTIGHTLELRYSVGHGRAVILGMLEELSVGEKLGKTNPRVRQVLTKTLEALGIVLNEKKYPIDIKSLMYDKKVTQKEISLPVIITIGRAVLIRLSLKRFISLVKE